VSLSALLARPGEVFGTWSQIASADLIDMLGVSGYAFTIVDCEHAAFGMETAEMLFRACRAAGVVPLIRVPENDRIWIGKSLDAGAAGVLVPGLETAEEAMRAVAATRFAPQGSRGACPCVRAGGHFIRDWPAYVSTQHTETGIIALVETQTGLDNIEAICAVDGIRALLIGPFDLSVSMGLAGDYLHPQVQAGVARMLAAARATSLPVIMPVFSPELDAAQAQVNRWRAEGIRHFVVGTDKILVSDQFSRYLGALSAR
jgi:4-hydroxy-2-oxoheptanedioate aldolase